jgi:serine/threonine protein kinase
MVEVAKNTEFSDYGEILAKHEIKFIEKEIWLQVGKASFNKRWLIFISVIKSQLPEMLEEVLPVLKDRNISFQIVKTRLLHQYINYGRYGDNYVGRVLTLYPDSGDIARQVVAILSPILKLYYGPKVNNSIQIGPALFAKYCELERGTDGKRFKKEYIPRRSQIPFEINAAYKVKSRKNRFFGKYYFAIKTLKSSSKGDIIKATRFKCLSFKWCIVKKGKLHMVDDFWGRTIKDRLLWQKKVMEDLYDKMDVPKVLDFFEEKDDSFLVMENIRGSSLFQTIKSLYESGNWRSFNTSIRKWILDYYLYALQIVNKIHHNGYIHRDIKAENFLVLPNSKPFILDFELSYSLKEQCPAPPFQAITPGYQAPEQLNNIMPAIKEDIYSLGALLLFLLTGTHPKEFVKMAPLMIKEKMLVMSISNGLIDTTINCLDDNPINRPEIDLIISVIYNQIIRL